MLARLLRGPWHDTPDALRVCQNSSFWSMQMKRPPRFDANERAMKQWGQITTVIADLDRVVQNLDCDIAFEEERVQIFDRADAAYPMLARTLATRRDNLRGTIAALEQRLASIKAPLVEPVAA
jgi:hypothetical protein